MNTSKGPIQEAIETATIELTCRKLLNAEYNAIIGVLGEVANGTFESKTLTREEAILHLDSINMAYRANGVRVLELESNLAGIRSTLGGQGYVF